MATIHKLAILRHADGSPSRLAKWLLENTDANVADDDSILEHLKRAVDSGQLDRKTLLSLMGQDERLDSDPLESLSARLEKQADTVIERVKRMEARQSMEGMDAIGPDSAVSPQRIFGGGGSKGGVRIEGRGPEERYSTVRYPAKHKRTGELVFDQFGSEATLPSQRTMAMVGAYCKDVARRNGTPIVLSEHDHSLLEAVYDQPWVGYFGGEWRERGNQIPGAQVKAALLNDAGSGGLEVNPAVFDAELVVSALLSGELLPHVTIKNLPRGSNVETALIGHPSVLWPGGTSEGSATSLFDSTDLINEILATVFPCVTNMEIGRDLLDDVAVNLGQEVIARCGEALSASLDDQIANGDGSTEPTGIFVASGISSVNSANGAAGPMTISDFENLMFGLTKAERQLAGGYYCFVGNDTTYRRAYGIPIGSDDVRRVHPDPISAYRISGVPFHVAVNVADGRIAYCNLKRYRLWRRLGQRLEIHTSGQTLALKNTALVCMRGRYAGKPVHAAGFVKMTDAQSTG